MPWWKLRGIYPLDKLTHLRRGYVYLLFSIMSTENENQNKPNESTFVLNFLKGLRFVDPKRLPEVLAFFSQAFIIHTEDENFDDSEYRSEWLDNINYLADLSKNVKGLKDSEIDADLSRVIEMLEKGGKNEN